VQELVRVGANVYITSRNQVDIAGVKKVITGVDVTETSAEFLWSKRWEPLTSTF